MLYLSKRCKIDPKIKRPIGRLNSLELLSDQIAFLSSPLVGRGGLEPPTSRLSGVRSNHLSYRPLVNWYHPIR